MSRGNSGIFGMPLGHSRLKCDSVGFGRSIRDILKVKEGLFWAQVI